MIGRLDVERHNGTHPTLTVDDVGHPTEFFHGLQYTTGKEDGSFTIVRIVYALFVFFHLALVEIVVIVDEIDLYLGCRDGCNLDDERMVGVINDKVHS